MKTQVELFKPYWGWKYSSDGNRRYPSDGVIQWFADQDISINFHDISINIGSIILNIDISDEDTMMIILTFPECNIWVNGLKIYQGTNYTMFA